MSSFNSFKEIYIDFERLGSIKQEEINYANTGEFKVRQSLNVSPDKRIGSKGLTVSLPNYIVFG